MTGGANVVENVVVLDEPEAEGDQARAEAVLPDQHFFLSSMLSLFIFVVYFNH